MKIYNAAAQSIPNLYTINENGNKPAMQTGANPVISHDTVEISPIGRQLAADAIEHHPAKYYGTAEINDSLNQLLNGKAPAVSKAVYTLIESNLMPDGSISNDADRAALLEMGLSQAKYIANNHMNGDEAASFLKTIDQIAAIAKTRTVDPVTGHATYTTPPQKPKGAPDDYVSISELMKRFEPDTYRTMNDAISSGGDWGSILIQFAKKVPQNKSWVGTYRKEMDQLVKDLRNTKIENRFEGADTSSIASFLHDMKGKIQNTSNANTDLLVKNMEHFARIIGHQAQL